TFKIIAENANESAKAFEVKDIGQTGMQLSRKDGGHSLQVDQNITGKIHWHSQELIIDGVVKWVKAQKLGVQFTVSAKRISDFLSLENIVDAIRPLHQVDLDVETPSNLKYWLHADGPVEVFVWRHNHGELSKLQVIYLENFVEWNDGIGIKSGKILAQRDLETPLVLEDEFVFQIDDEVDKTRVELAKNLIENIPVDYLTLETLEFLKLKLG
ncbi:MAG: hypothetical protein ACI9J3_002152, partial [Parvicellaceae bacterium]